MQLSQDPRLDKPSTYNREEAITAVAGLYQFLATLPYIEPTDILYPPPEGWPHITQENEAFASLKKTDDVIELLRHLPYLDCRREDWQIMPFSTPCDYVNQDPGKYRPLAPDDFKFPPWVINFIFSGSYDKSLMFDTSDGTVTEHIPSGWEDEPDYSEDDPRYWRVECEDKTVPLADYLDIVKEKFLNLLWVSYVQKVGSWPWIFEWNDAPGHENDDEETNAMRDVYFAHRWPDSFDREACQEALENWYRRGKKRRTRERNQDGCQLFSQR